VTPPALHKLRGGLALPDADFSKVFGPGWPLGTARNWAWDSPLFVGHGVIVILLPRRECGEPGIADLPTRSILFTRV